MDTAGQAPVSAHVAPAAPRASMAVCGSAVLGGPAGAAAPAGIRRILDRS
jgi:hypothetical protein